MSNIKNLLKKLEEDHEADDRALEGVLNLVYAAAITGSAEKLLIHCSAFAKNQVKELQKEIELKSEGLNLN